MWLCLCFIDTGQKGFPLDMTLDDLSEFFNKFGKTEQVQMRKDAKKNFKVC